MDNYNKVIECFKNTKCKLLTNYDEFELRRKISRNNSYHFVRVDFIGLCMHPSNAVFTNFNLRKTGSICKKCVNQQSKNIERQNCNEIELMGIKIFEEYLTDYEIIRTKEGCRADLVIKSKTDNKWIPIQIKTTLKPTHNMYSFKKCNKDYNGMLLVCICITERKIWILPFNAEIKSTINICIKSKYNKYLILNDKITNYIEQYRNNIILTELETLLIPVSPLQQREQEYVRKRETLLPFLQYSYPDIQGGSSDFICNQKKVQEKVLGFHKNILHTGLYVSNGTKNGKRLYRKYILGENDYYWFHSSIDDRFWIIPEKILYDAGYISSELSKHIDIRFTGNKWDKYQYDYNHVDTDIISRIFL